MKSRIIAFLGVTACVMPWHCLGQQNNNASSQQLTLPATCGELKLTAVASNAIRVRCGDPKTTALPELVYTKPQTVQASTGSDAQSSWLQTSEIRAVVDKDSGRVRFLTPGGTLLTEESVDGRQLRKTSEDGHDELSAEVRYTLQPGEHLYGSGQFQDGYLDIARLPRKLVQLNTQIAIPFVLSSKGYGLLWHNYGMTELNKPENHLALDEAGTGEATSVDITTSSGNERQKRQAKQFTGSLEIAKEGDYALVLDSGRTMTDRYNVSMDGREVLNFQNFWLPGSTSTITHFTAGRHKVIVQANALDHPSLEWGPVKDETSFQSPNAREIDYTIFAGNADQVIGSYRALSGEAPLMPKWAFGFIQCRERYHSTEELVDTVKQFRADKLPLDTIVQDWQYWGKYGWNAMRFDEQFYPNPKQMVDDLHKDHAHLMVSVWSRFDPKSDVGKQFEEKKLFLPGTTWVDFLNPTAAALYWQNFSTRMLSLGIDAWWLDATEPENDDLHERKTFLGDGDDYRLSYPLFVTKTVYEGSRKDAPDKRVMILTRSAFLGEQRYGISTWSGDIGNSWDTLKRQVTGGLDYMASGLPYWTTDTGGFFRPSKDQFNDPAYHERFLRWMEYSVFTPLLRVHGYQTNTEPWNYGPEMVEQERKILDLRSQLLPYIYSQAADVTFHGGTMMRPLVMDFLTDEKALQQKYEYMFGPAFLVSPVLDAGVTTVQVYAPQTPGGWYEWTTGQPVASGAEATIASPIEKIPVLVRAGSIVPLGPVQQYVGEDKNPPEEIRIYPGAGGQFTLYDDDGQTYAYEHGQSSRIGLTWDDQSKTLHIAAREGKFAGMPESRTFNVKYINPQKPSAKAVTYTGRTIDLHF